MSYIIHITATAERDIIRAADYIEFNLKNPTAADHLLDVATKQINSLADMPQKFRLVDDPVLASWEIRYVIVNNYLAFSTIDEEKRNRKRDHYFLLEIPLIKLLLSEILCA